MNSSAVFLYSNNFLWEINQLSLSKICKKNEKAQYFITTWSQIVKNDKGNDSEDLNIKEKEVWLGLSDGFKSYA